jgi:micrococcal nuclease
MPPSRVKRSRKRHWLISTFFVLAIVILALTLRFVEEIGLEQKPDNRFIVIKVIDGDTVELAGGDRLRLLGIDTPEKGERFYSEATELLGNLVLGKTARIEYANVRRDRYGRLLGFLYVEDSIFANQRILDSGLGYLYLFDDQEIQLPEFQQMLESQVAAVTDHRGIWSLDKKPEEYYLATKKSYRFHRPGCRSISGSNPDNLRVFETKEEALIEGLSPCRNCHP